MTHQATISTRRKVKPVVKVVTGRKEARGVCSHSPQPPHVSVLVGEKAVRVIAAVLEVTEAAAEKRRGVAVRPGARESRHQHLLFAPVALARRAHLQPMWRARRCLASSARSVQRWIFPLCVSHRSGGAWWRWVTLQPQGPINIFLSLYLPPYLSLFCFRFNWRATAAAPTTSTTTTITTTTSTTTATTIKYQWSFSFFFM